MQRSNMRVVNSLSILAIGIVLVESLTLGDLKGRHFNIMTVLDEPFVSINYFERGNDRFSGYAIEMLQTVAARGEFSYTLKLPDNGTFDSAVAAVETGVADMVWGSFFLTGSRAAKVNRSGHNLNFDLTVLDSSILRQPLLTLACAWWFGGRHPGRC